LALFSCSLAGARTLNWAWSPAGIAGADYWGTLPWCQSPFPLFQESRELTPGGLQRCWGRSGCFSRLIRSELKAERCSSTGVPIILRSPGPSRGRREPAAGPCWNCRQNFQTKRRGLTAEPRFQRGPQSLWSTARWWTRWRCSWLCRGKSSKDHPPAIAWPWAGLSGGFAPKSGRRRWNNFRNSYSYPGRRRRKNLLGEQYFGGRQGVKHRCVSASTVEPRSFLLPATLNCKSRFS
jgi:hypothetical protein